MRTPRGRTLQPYVQFTHVPSLPTQGTGAASTYGAALLMSYDFGNAATPAALRLPGFKLPLRLEYIAPPAMPQAAPPTCCTAGQRGVVADADADLPVPALLRAGRTVLRGRAQDGARTGVRRGRQPARAGAGVLEVGMLM